MSLLGARSTVVSMSYAPAFSRRLSNQAGSGRPVWLGPMVGLTVSPDGDMQGGCRGSNVRLRHLRLAYVRPGHILNISRCYLPRNLSADSHSIPLLPRPHHFFLCTVAQRSLLILSFSAHIYAQPSIPDVFSKVAAGHEHGHGHGSRKRTN